MAMHKEASIYSLLFACLNSLILLALPICVNAKEEIKIGISNLPPYTIVNENYVSGIDIDVAVLMAKKLDLKIKYIICPWKRCLMHMRKGDVDMLPGVIKRPEREEYMHFINPHYVQGKNAFYIHKDNALKIKHYADLKDLKIGIERGSKLFEPFDSDTNLIKYEVTDLLQAIDMTQVKRLDTFVASSIVSDYLLLNHYPVGEFKKSKYQYKGKSALAYFALSRKSRYVKQYAFFDNTMRKIVNTGEIEIILKRFSKKGSIQKYNIN